MVIMDHQFYETPSMEELAWTWNGIICASGDEPDGLYDGEEIERP